MGHVYYEIFAECLCCCLISLNEQQTVCSSVSAVNVHWPQAFVILACIYKVMDAAVNLQSCYYSRHSWRPPEICSQQTSGQLPLLVCCCVGVLPCCSSSLFSLLQTKPPVFGFRVFVFSPAFFNLSERVVFLLCSCYVPVLSSRQD